MSSTVPDQIEEILEPLLRERALQLVDMDVKRAGARTIVRVFVSGTDGNVTLDRCADLSRELSFQLDKKGVIQGPFILEVSSPGLDRRLRSDRELEWAMGRRVLLIAKNGEFKGTLAGHSEREIHVDLEDGPRTFERSGIIKLKLDEVRS
jgi:ribosome maturation factor RimP